MMDCVNKIGHYQCTTCNFETSILTFIKQHLKNGCEYKIPEEVIYKCSKCHFLTYSRYLMARHGFYKKCATTDDERNKLFACYRVDNTENNLFNEDASSLDIQLIPIKSQQSEQFVSDFKDNLWQPEQNKNSLKPNKSEIRFQCEHCSSKFTRQSNLKNHIKCRHSKPENIQWFECEQCSSRFKRKDVLNRHKKIIHASEDDIQWFKCEHCPMKFKHKHCLVSHITHLHMDPKDITWFRCELCPSKFKTNSCLKRHKRYKHARGESVCLFECALCPKKYKEKRHLITHINNHHTDTNWLKCDQCPVRFKRKGSLNRHKKSCHC